MARWRTSLAAAAIVLFATACSHTEAAHQAGATATAPSKPQLAPVDQKPLTARGTGFRPNEKVSVVANGVHNRSTSADSSGAFVVRLPGVNRCDSITVVAAGSRGSHAEFNLSQIACMDE